MPSPEENSGPVSSLPNDVQENVRLFNEDEAVWLRFTRKRVRRKRLQRLLRLLDSPPALAEKHSISLVRPFGILLPKIAKSLNRHFAAN